MAPGRRRGAVRPGVGGHGGLARGVRARRVRGLDGAGHLRYLAARFKAGAGTHEVRHRPVWEEDGAAQYAALPPDAQWARDAMESIRRGDVDRSCCGFRVPRGGARWERRDGYDLRIVSRAELVELGPLTFAAYEDTSVAVREHKTFQERMVARADAELRLEIDALRKSSWDLIL